jgi:hypothetical protein
MSHLNYFEPYQSKKKWHEDQLTRAFMVVLRFSPSALLLFYDYACNCCRDLATKKNTSIELPALSTLDLNNIAFDCQISDLSKIISNRLLSVLITDEEFAPTTDVANCDRGCRYDGVVSFSTDITFIIENKPKSYNVWEQQLSPNLGESHDVEIIPVASILEWKEIVKLLNALKRLSSVSGAEKIIIDDFLDFVDRNFSYLNPYDNFALCKNDQSLLNRRIKNILEALVTNKEIVRHHGSWANCIETNLDELRLIGLVLNYPEENKEWKLELSFHYGDTMNQAREVYKRNIDYKKISDMTAKGWVYMPNFHISHIQTHLQWFSTPVDSKEAYYRAWQQKYAKRMKQYDKKGLLSFLEELREEKLIILEDDDRSGLKDEVEETNRNNFNVCPGFSLIYSYSASRATELDVKKELLPEIKSRMLEGLSILTNNTTFLK